MDCYKGRPQPECLRPNRRVQVQSQIHQHWVRTARSSGQWCGSRLWLLAGLVTPGRAVRFEAAVAWRAVLCIAKHALCVGHAQLLLHSKRGVAVHSGGARTRTLSHARSRAAGWSQQQQQAQPYSSKKRWSRCSRHGHLVICLFCAPRQRWCLNIYVYPPLQTQRTQIVPVYGSYRPHSTFFYVKGRERYLLPPARLYERRFRSAKTQFLVREVSVLLMNTSAPTFR